MSKLEEMQHVLNGFTGTDQYYAVMPGVVCSDGGQYLRDNEHAWLLDIIASVQSELKGEEFQVWVMKRIGRGCVVEGMDDRPGRILYKQEVEYTDSPFEELVLYCDAGVCSGKPVMVIYLPSEY